MELLRYLLTYAREPLRLYVPGGSVEPLYNTKILITRQAFPVLSEKVSIDEAEAFVRPYSERQIRRRIERTKYPVDIDSLRDAYETFLEKFGIERGDASSDLVFEERYRETLQAIPDSLLDNLRFMAADYVKESARDYGVPEEGLRKLRYLIWTLLRTKTLLETAIDCEEYRVLFQSIMVDFKFDASTNVPLLTTLQSVESLAPEEAEQELYRYWWRVILHQIDAHLWPLEVEEIARAWVRRETQNGPIFTFVGDAKLQARMRALTQ